eukprot:1979954-Alexandrium_andersonii.AAC.1
MLGMRARSARARMRMHTGGQTRARRHTDMNRQMYRQTDGQQESKATTYVHACVLERLPVLMKTPHVQQL